MQGLDSVSKIMKKTIPILQKTTDFPNLRGVGHTPQNFEKKRLPGVPCLSVLYRPVFIQVLSQPYMLLPGGGGITSMAMPSFAEPM